MANKRTLSLDICDYNNRVVCNLYDSRADISGQAYDVFVKTERNGWKELSFNIPSVCMGENGKEKNYRLEYLIADYRIKLQDDYETDYYLISENKIQHNKKSKTVSVVAGHISQLLKTKNLDLEFSDQEGNNVGTISELLTAILEGTGWTIGTAAAFYEDDGSQEKVRTLNEPVKTGAFKMITDTCDLFEAKAIFHGGNRTIDILPMNPFSRDIRFEDDQMKVYGPINLMPGEIPSVAARYNEILEMHYDRNVKGISRTLNTENLITRLYAYGNYGDMNGYAGINICTHNEYRFHLTYRAGTELAFEIDRYRYYFTAPEDMNNSLLIYSDLDQMSQTYLWNETTRTAYHVYKEPKTSDFISVSYDESEIVQNWFSSIMNFSYYDEIGLLTEEMFQHVASYQRDMITYIQDSETATENYSKKLLELSDIGNPVTGFAKLDVDKYENDNGVLKVVLKKENSGIVYRSDYMNNKRNYFTWYVANSLKENGDPVTNIGSVLFIVHDTNPVTWDKVYLRKINDLCHIDETTGETVNDPYIYAYTDGPEPEYFTVWANYGDIPAKKNSDRFYLLASNSMMGYLGAKQVADESVVQALESSTKVMTIKHPVYFEEKTANSPSASVAPIVNDETAEIEQRRYGWCYVYDPKSTTVGDLYFCYASIGDREWHRAYCQEYEPESSNGDYFFDTKFKKLYHKEGTAWRHLDTTDDKKIASVFTKVNYYCLRRDMLYKGLYDKYYYTPTQNMPKGNYTFANAYGFYWTFTTDQDIPAERSIYLDTGSNEYRIYQDDDVNHIVPVVTREYSQLTFPEANIIYPDLFSNGTINQDGVEENSDTYYRSRNIEVYDDITYAFSLPSASVAYCYDEYHRLTKDGNGQINGVINLSGSRFTTPHNTSYIRLVCQTKPTSSHYIQIENYDQYVFVQDERYKIIPFDSIVPGGLLKGINYLTKQFADLADETYDNYLKAAQTAQKAVTDKDNELKEELGDMYREGWWQDSKYVEGDEQKLYKDAKDNLFEVSKPEATYTIDFLDLYGSQPNDIDESDVEWPDLNATYAAHLIDPEINVNLWGYIDTLNKCYDKPWQTTLEVNTNLSVIGQHSFTDVMSRIAEVANETKAKQTIYARAAAITSTGKMVAEKLEGAINANRNAIEGGASNWYTDENGHIVFESADGLSAMMLGGAGWMIANSKNSDGDWEFRTTATGAGITADEITTGTLRAILIEAGSITADKLSAAVGQELDIASNVALNIYATEDGFRPAGGVLTPKVNEGDSYIQIAAKKDGNPAYINVMTGGVLNLQGSTMNLNAGSTMDLKAGSNLSIKSDADIEINANSKLNIKSGSDLTIDSPNFKVYQDQGKYIAYIDGRVIANEGEIAGFTIGAHKNSQGQVDYRYLYSGTSSIDSTVPGIYIGTNGINFGGGKFKVSSDGETVKLNIKASDITLSAGHTMQDEINGTTSTVTREYILSSTSDKVTNGSYNWSTIVPDPVGTYKYIFSRDRYVYKDGTTRTTSPVRETGFGANADEVYNEYVKSTSNTTAPTTGWSRTIPTLSDFTKDETTKKYKETTKEYIWVRTVKITKDGQVSVIEAPTVDEGLGSSSNARVLGLNVASGVYSVPYVDTTGVEIKDDNITVRSRGSLDLQGNSGVHITNSEGNDLIAMDKNGITIATEANIAMAAGGILNIDASKIKLTSTQSVQDEIDKTHTDINNTISTTTREYRLSTSDSSPEGNYNWLTYIPQPTANAKYIFSRDHYVTNNNVHSYSSAILETGYGSNTSSTYNEYAQNNDKNTAPTTGWSQTIPVPNASNPYVWVRKVTVSLYGATTYSTATRDQGLESASANRIWSLNVASGAQSVPYVKTNGLTINNDGVSLTSTTKLNIAANQELQLTNSSGNNMIKLDNSGISIASAADVVIASGSKIEIGAAGKLFTVSSDTNRAYIYYGKTNINDKTNSGIYIGTDGLIVGKGSGDYVQAKADGTINISGKIDANTGSIAGFTIDKHTKTDGTVDYRYLYSGTNSLTSTTPGIYIGTNGINFGGGKFIVSSDGNTVKLNIDASNVTMGNTTLKSSLDTIGGKANTAQTTADTAQTKADTAQSTADAATKTYRCYASTIVTKPYKVGDIWVDIGNSYGIQYVCQGVSSTRNSTTDWVMTGTAVTAGAKLNVDADAGTINMVSANSITIAAGATISIAAGKKLSLTTAGTVEIGNGGKPFTIGSDGTNAYIYNGKTKYNDTTNSGVYIGTNGIIVGKASGNYVQATADGTIKVTGEINASSGSIGSGDGKWTISSSSIYNNKKSIDNVDNANGVYIGTDGISLGRYGSSGSYTSAFKVTKAGELIAKNATITGNITATDGTFTGTINATAGTIGSNSTSGNRWQIGSTSIYNNINGLTKTNENGGVYIGTDGISVYGSSTSYFRFYSKEAKFAIRAGMEGISDTTHTEGLYMSQEGIALGGGKFKVTKAGALTATSATITGAINATSGTIGSNSTAGDRWQIGSNSIYNGQNSLSSTTPGVYIGTNGISIYNSSTSYFRFYSTAESFAVRAGMEGINDTTHTEGLYIGNSGIALGGGKFKVTKAGALTATSATITGKITSEEGKIGGLTINSNRLSIKVGSNADSVGMSDGTYAGTGEGAQTGIAFWAGTSDATPINAKFLVGTNGYMKASNATITGSVTATSGTIGGVTINEDYGMYTNSKTSATSTKTGFLISKDGAIYLGAYDNTTGVKSCPFQITSTGALTARNATINGTITSTAGKIGGLTINEHHIGLANNKVGLSDGNYGSQTGIIFWAGDAEPKNANLYIGNAGFMYATNVDISGKITATSGTIGGLTLSEHDMHTSDSKTGLGDGTTTSGVVLWAGGATPTTAPFRVGNTGFFASTSGNIGSWDVSSTDLHYGTGNKATYLNGSGKTGTTNWAIWTGADYPDQAAYDAAPASEKSGKTKNAPFRVKRDGSVYLTKIIAVKQNGETTTEEEINLTSGGNRLCGATITSWNTSGDSVIINTTYGQITFNSAASGYNKAASNSHSMRTGNTVSTTIPTTGGGTKSNYYTASAKDNYAISWGQAISYQGNVYVLASGTKLTGSSWVEWSEQ